MGLEVYNGAKANNFFLHRKTDALITAAVSEENVVPGCFRRKGVHQGKGGAKKEAECGFREKDRKRRGGPMVRNKTTAGHSSRRKNSREGVYKEKGNPLSQARLIRETFRARLLKEGRERTEGKTTLSEIGKKKSAE